MTTQIDVRTFELETTEMSAWLDSFHAALGKTPPIVLTGPGRLETGSLLWWSAPAGITTWPLKAHPRSAIPRDSVIEMATSDRTTFAARPRESS